jgi:hypothetical protein
MINKSKLKTYSKEEWDRPSIVGHLGEILKENPNAFDYLYEPKRDKGIIAYLKRLFK